jgi:hypothetical protein
VLTASATHVDAGESVTLTVSYQQCGGGPEHRFTITARPLGQQSPITTVGHVTTPSGDAGSAGLTVMPERSTTYMAAEDGQTYSQLPYVDVTVDQTAGACAGVLVLRAPARVPAGSSVPLTGTASDTSTVTILFRKRGQAQFQARRALTPAPNGAFTTPYRGDDDYRIYAATSRCDSPPVLVQTAPTVTGPAVVVRGSAATVRVRAAVGVAVVLYFHRAGTAGYALARRGTTGPDGAYATTYRADADYRYYAVTGPDSRRTTAALTQTK